MLHVDPVTHTPREILPHVFVLEDGFAAFGVESRDAVFLDFTFVLEPEFLLDFDFDR